MRAGALADDTVIELLNAHFVPVYVSNEDYSKDGSAPPEEKKEKDRIFRAALAAKLSTGTVHVYVLTPQGEPIDSIHVAQAKPDRVIAVLRKAIERFKVPAGEPGVKPRPQAASPEVPAGGVRLHLTARSLDGRGAWGGFPGENWIVLSREEAAAFLPAAGSKAGAAWDVPRDLALRLLHHFYPSTENNDPRKNEIETAEMKAVLRADMRVRLDVRLRMKHPFYHKKDACTVDATAVGIVEPDPESRGIRSFRMATERATYNGGTFGVAIRSVP